MKFNGDIELIGIDISAQQLARSSHISKRIQGDLQTYEHPSASFDAIVCWNVLEHLPNPEAALMRFARAIRPEGLIILAMPNVMSPWGLLTKFTPHWFHVAFYRYVRGNSDAGKNGVGPFKTYLRFSIAPQALQRWAQDQGLKTLYVKTFSHIPKGRNRRAKLTFGLYRFVHWAGVIGSLGKLGDCEYIIVLGFDPP